MKNEIQILKKENESIRQKNTVLIKENKVLKEKLYNFNSIKDQEIRKIEEKYKNLIFEKIKNVENFIYQLNNNTVQVKNKNNLLAGEKLIAINFKSVDQKINDTIICKNKTKFHIIEDQLYEKYPEYVNGENFFLFNGHSINRFKTLDDNGINGYTIMLKKVDE